MAGLEELKKKLGPLFDAEKGFSNAVDLDLDVSYMVSDHGTVNLMSGSCGYNINELGFQKCPFSHIDNASINEKTYRCASSEMQVFGVIGFGASSIVHRAIHIPVHRILALKKINVFEKDKRQQLLNEMQTLCEAPCYEGLVEFHGAFYTPNSGQINIALEYVDGGSLSDVLRLKKAIPESVLSLMVEKFLHALNYLHGVRHLVHRDIKPANLLLNLKGEVKITDFGISSGLENSIAMCATFVGTVTYMSPERIRNEHYSYPADIWSLGLSLLECGMGEFPYSANEGPVNLMLQILDDPSPSPAKESFSSEFCSFVDACLQKDPDARPTAEQLLSHPFITKHKKMQIDLAAYVQNVFDPIQRLKDLADMLTAHYYLLFDGSDEIWHHARTLYKQSSTLSFSDKIFLGASDIFDALTGIRRTLVGSLPQEKLVHSVENVQCRRHGEDGIAIRVSGSFVIGTHLIICGDTLAEGMPSQTFSPDVVIKQMGIFHEQFVLEPGFGVGCYFIVEQNLFIHQA